MEKESYFTYFTKDANWVQPFLIGSILYFINTSLNSSNSKEALVNLGLLIAIVIVSCLTQGYFALNTNSLVNCQNGEVKLAKFNDPLKIFVTGLKYNLAVFIYGFGIGLTAAFVVPAFVAGGAVGIAILGIWILAVVYLLWMFIYMSFAYSRFLTFRSMFEFSNFGKYRVGKYFLCILLFIILAAAVSVFFAVVMKDKKTFTYFIALLLAPAAMWYSFILSKIQAESIQDAIAKENAKSGTIPNIQR